MSNYIKSIELHNVHGIRNTLELNFDEDKRHVLLYGYNGSGKTSLFRAIGAYLKTVQSRQSIQTIKHRSQLSQSAKITFIVADGTRDHELMWSDYPETYPNHLLLSECAQSLGYLSYNDVLELSFAFRNQHSMDVFPYLQSVVFYHAETQWSRPLSIIQSEIDELVRNNKKVPEQLIKEYNDTLTNVTQKVKELANTYIKEYFCNQKLRIELRKNQDYNVKNKPQVQLTAVLESEQHDDFFKFMNEALVSTIAFALYFASLKLVGKSNLPFLVLDDIHLALDDVSRYHLINLIKTEFAEYQILFMSHDLTYCEYLATKTDSNDTSKPLWDYRKLVNAAHISRHNEDLLDVNVVNTYINSGQTTHYLGELRKYLERKLYNKLVISNPSITIRFKVYADQHMILSNYMTCVESTIVDEYRSKYEATRDMFMSKDILQYIHKPHHYQENPQEYSVEFIQQIITLIRTYIEAVDLYTTVAAPAPDVQQPLLPRQLSVADLNINQILTGTVHSINDGQINIEVCYHDNQPISVVPLSRLINTPVYGRLITTQPTDLTVGQSVTVRVKSIDTSTKSKSKNLIGRFELELVPS